MASTSSDESQNPATHPPTQPMRISLPALFRETLAVSGRYFVIIYPVFMYFILLNIMGSGLGSQFNPMDWTFWAMILAVIAIQFIFQAGWGTMMFRAVLEWESLSSAMRRGEPSPDGEPVRTPFWVFKEFIPGVGQFGIPFVLGGFIWMTVLALLTVGIITACILTVGVPDALLHLAKAGHVMTQKEMTQLAETLRSPTFINGLNHADQMRLEFWSAFPMILMALWAFVSIFSLYWQPYLIMHETNPFRAFGMSIKKVWRNPLPALTIYMAYITAYLLIVMLGTALSGMMFVAHFLMMFSTVYFGILTYLYLVRSDDFKLAPPTES